MSVVTIAQFRQQTKDVTTSDAGVASALQEAEEQVIDYLRRELEAVERTEIAIVTAPFGYVYPAVTPVLSVTTPSSTNIIDGQYITDPGDNYPSSGGSSFEPWFVSDSYENDGRFTRTQIVYVGGWTSVTMPSTIRRAIIDLANVFKAAYTTFVAGASSVSLGDASVSFGSAPPTHYIDTVVPGITSRLKGYRAR